MHFTTDGSVVIVAGYRKKYPDAVSKINTRNVVSVEDSEYGLSIGVKRKNNPLSVAKIEIACSKEQGAKLRQTIESMRKQ